MAHSHHSDCCNHEPASATKVVAVPQKDESSWRSHLDLLGALAILVVMLVLLYGFKIQFPNLVNLMIYGTAWLLAGWSVMKMAFRKVKRGDFFNEFVLMTVATIGAFLLGEYSEGVAVMVFYSIGEWFQDAAVSRAKRNIKRLMDVRPDQVTVLRNGKSEIVNSSSVKLNETVQVKAGEKVGLDGELLSETASFNSTALTGESRPDTKTKGELVLAGMINLNTPAELKVNALFKDSRLSRILEMVQDATARKSRTQLFISRFAKVYTPIVFFLAFALCVLPYFFVADYNFNTWFYRSLVFLVISCPCALVVSIPLGYFGGIGLASRNGILFKGGNFLDVIAKTNVVVMDKTGTLTKGVFKVISVEAEGLAPDRLVYLAGSLESLSNHPVARAIGEYYGTREKGIVRDAEEIPGMGIRGTVDDQIVTAGNNRLLEQYGISYPVGLNDISDTIVLVAINDKYAGYFRLGDELKEDAKRSVTDLKKAGLKVVMLSGDKQTVVSEVGRELGIDEAYGDLMPEDKVNKLQLLKQRYKVAAFVGDGINDAPVLALADSGIAMGGLGTDAAIETADIVIQNDQPSKILTAIRTGKITRSIVWQNIVLAMLVKVLVLIWGAGGMASLWEAVIADVGVALLAILNAVRIQRISLG
ncbi:heavy metal translocating P-type ATPase [Desertivirga brevis]|uniref:heavy metal translocating P-type ATPase n=1 Tax=Desertivirga brevis TaxID=2810310 RepID=UPI001A96B593|nr:heavy metal translocating P-type ATPase [Pedobacter sp. SYSU D00873]